MSSIMASSEPSKLPQFSPPGNLGDLNDHHKTLWSKNYISYWIDGEISADPKVAPDRKPLEQFFNGTKTPFDRNAKPATITWTAFPKKVQTEYDDDLLRWKVADASRIFQDEYLEWSVQRSSKGDILSATFTCEGPEYWQFFASYQRDGFIDKMRDLNSDFKSNMKDDDFFLTDPSTGHQVYNPNNYWNTLSTTGTIAHLVQPNNTLSAQIDIAGQATVLRKDKKGKLVTGSDQLIRCSAYGNPGRHSDPQIGSKINAAARDGTHLTVADPVALYIYSIDKSRFKFDMVKTTGTANREDLEDIKDIDQIFQFQRGDINKNQGLRFRVKVPDGLIGHHKQQLTVSNIYDTDTGQHIRYGGQIADYVQMSVSASAIPKGKKADPIPCVGEMAKASESEQDALFAAESVEDGINEAAEVTYPLAKEAGRGFEVRRGDDYQV